MLKTSIFSYHKISKIAPPMNVSLSPFSH